MDKMVHEKFDQIRLTLMESKMERNQNQGGKFGLVMKFESESETKNEKK